MSYVVVGTREGDGWTVDVSGVGRSTADDLAEIEASAREVLREHGVADHATVDLQLLLPDFEVDLQRRGVPDHGLRPVEIVSGVIALVVVVGALAFLLGRLLG
ncbi:hypothetical protein IDH50_15200 [Aeromicrobium tamlense]|uniref:Membrane protein YdbT with pleckstrin-like domain n=1 Tax=Aeromicrobium tamlense TaxID=375541 RepID=A0A8I0FVU9_9ACTN|nr:MULTISPECIES: hypothetical protein [Aeromicrobium]MBD1271589.1 hypothetical protein [Aeromicrobium tamlense]NYI37665.1 putative membrane protein YdbT with pleckstrin-like domain [Aeromicrobium tamlense]